MLYGTKNKYNCYIKKTPKDDKQNQCESFALAEIVEYVREGPQMSYVTDIAKLYGEKLKQMDAYVPERIHSSHLAQRVIDQVPNLVLKKGNSGKLYLAFANDIAAAAEQQFKLKE